MNTERDYLRNLIMEAKTPEDLRAAEELLRGLQTPKPLRAASAWTFRTLGEVAEFFGVALQTVKQWRTESPPMPGDENGYPVRDVVLWRERKLQGSTITEEKRLQELELGRIRLEQERMALAKDQGQTVLREDVERWAAVALTELREGIMQLPAKVIQTVEPEQRAQVREDVTLHCINVLDNTARQLELRGLGVVWIPE